MKNFKYISLVVSFALAVGIILWGLFYFYLPHYYNNWFEVIVIFFLVFETAEVWFIASSSRKATARQLLNNYLLSKVVKMAASLVFVGIYYLAVGEGMKNFILIFIIFYILFLLFETFIFLRIEKRLKEKQQQDEK